MRTGDLIATAAPGLVSKGIRKVTRSQVSHVAGVIVLHPAGRRRLFIVESHRQSGVVLVALCAWIRAQEGPVWWWPGCIPDAGQGNAYADEAMSHLGEPYEEDKWMLTRVALGLTPPTNSRWFCSELDLQARAAAGVNLAGAGPRKWPEDCARLYGGIRTAVGLSC